MHARISQIIRTLRNSPNREEIILIKVHDVIVKETHACMLCMQGNGTVGNSLSSYTF